MTLESDKTVFLEARRAYDRYVCMNVNEHSSVEEYLKVKEEALNVAAAIIAKYREDSVL